MTNNLSPPPSDADGGMAQAERRAKRFWVSLVVLLLGLQVAIGGASLWLATSDPSAAVVPDYHNAALNWDASQKAKYAAARLGWTLRLAAAEVADASGQRAIELVVLNAAGEPVDELQVTGQIYHHARASEARPIVMKSVGAGRYLTMGPMSADGLWEIEIFVAGGVEPMSQTVTFVAG